MPTTDRPFTQDMIHEWRRAAEREPVLVDTHWWEGGDRSVKGFGVRIRRRTSGGRLGVQFVFQYDDAAGKTRKITLGEYGQLTIPQARAQAQAQRQQVRDARLDSARPDPAARRQDARSSARAAAAAQTLAETARSFIADRTRRGLAPGTIKEYERLLKANILPRLGDAKTAKITRAQVRELHEARAATPVAADAELTLLRAIFNFAEAHDIRPAHSNPCRGVEPYRPAPRDRELKRPLTDAEYEKLGRTLLLAATEALPVAPSSAKKDAKRGMSAARRAASTGRKRGPYKFVAAPRGPEPANEYAIAALTFLAITGWRPGEVMGNPEEGGAPVRWPDIDFDRGVAVLPSTKTGLSIRPLGKLALALLRMIPKVEGNDHVFVGAREGLPLGGCTRLWESIRHVIGFKQAPYALRHSFITRARRSGYDNAYIGAIVGHSTKRTMTEEYGAIPEELLVEIADRTSLAIAERMRLATLIAMVAEKPNEVAGVPAASQ